jgi:hypothetical protein
VRDVKEGGKEEVLIKGRDVEGCGKVSKEKVRRKVEKDGGMWRKGCSKLER